jgi:hypothetical protein
MAERRPLRPKTGRSSRQAGVARLAGDRSSDSNRGVVGEGGEIGESPTDRGRVGSELRGPSRARVSIRALTRCDSTNGAPRIPAGPAGLCSCVYRSAWRSGIELRAPDDASRRGESWHGARSRRRQALYLRTFSFDLCPVGAPIRISPVEVKPTFTLDDGE